MSKKMFLFLLLLCSVAGQAWAYRTNGGGKYSFYRLSQTEGSGVTMEILDGMMYFTLNENDTISAGDFFDGSKECVVRFASGVTFVVEGKADFQAIGSLTLTTVEGAEGAVGICLKDTEEPTNFGGCRFIGVGLKFQGESAGGVYWCTFQNNNGSIGQAALILGESDTPYTVSHCNFTDNPKAAISSGAEMLSQVDISTTQFMRNGTANEDTPQLSLAASSLIHIENCTITGDAAHSMVGGISITNPYGMEDTDIAITNCLINQNRYGISLNDPHLKMRAVIAKNQIIGNQRGVTITGCKDINLGQPASSAVQSPGRNLFKDNGNGTQLCDLYNDSPNIVWAQNNTWNVTRQTEEEIEAVIYHQHDDPSLGEVIFIPAMGMPGPNGIGAIRNDTHQSAPATYTLQGTKTQQPKRGIYIQDGKKVRLSPEGK